MVSILQIVVLAFVLFAWSRVVLRLREGSISKKEAVFWSILWIAVIVVALLPQTAIAVSEVLGTGRAVDLIMYVSILLLFYLVFRMYVKIDQLSTDLTRLVREITLRRKK